MGPLKLLAMGDQVLDSTALSSAVGLTVPAGANVVVLSVSGANSSVNWRDNTSGKTPPSSSVGINIATGQAPYEYYGNLSGIAFITSTGSPSLTAAFFKIAG